jgi:hypothetical protein
MPLARLPISLALVAALACSWVTGPRYVCLESDGGACVDGGPQACHCETDSHEAPAAIADQEISPQPGVHSDACDCEHQLLAAAPSNAASRTSNASAELAKSAPMGVMLPLGLSGDVAAKFRGGAISLGTLASPPQHLIACVVLRC